MSAPSSPLLRRLLRAGLSALVSLGLSPLVWAHPDKAQARLATIGPAPAFSLTDQSGQRVALADLRGKVLALTFIYTTCRDTCPVLTAKMASMQGRLGADFGAKVRFVSITVEPEVDTPGVLPPHEPTHGADLAGWSFLTGDSADVQEVVRRYGAFARRARAGLVDHLFLTSLIDARGVLRVQYLGTRFSADEMLSDLRSLVRE
jgi:protein SCO1